jgi:tRNA(His) guanylyltransferase
MANSEYEYVKREFEFDRCLPPSNWIVVRIDGCHFHRYTSQISMPPFEEPSFQDSIFCLSAKF